MLQIQYSTGTAYPSIYIYNNKQLIKNYGSK